MTPVAPQSRAQLGVEWGRRWLRQCGLRWAPWTAAGLLAIAGCTPAVRQFELRQQALSCDEANRLAYETLTAMGYSVTSVDPARAGKPGVLLAVRSDARPAAVRVECMPTGVDIDAAEVGAVVGQADFKRGFLITFLSLRTARAGEKELSGHMMAGTAPASLQRKDVQVVVEPLRGARASLDFDVDLAAGGVLPVRLAIRNLTAHRYRLDPTAVRLTGADGERVPPLSPDRAAALLTSTDAAVAGRLRERLFDAKRIDPHAEVSGYLYFPLANYTQARVVLTDDESEEVEGFVIEF
jgi:hypothetical protein